MIVWPLLAAPPIGWGLYTLGAHCLLFGGLRCGPRHHRAIALTFDDGPDPHHTVEVLRILSRHGVRGTFFLVGRRALAAPQVVRAIAQEGHEIGNHTWSHRNLWWCSPGRTREEICRGADALADLTGAAPRFFRPPWGMVNLSVFPILRRLNTRCVFWSIQPEGLYPSEPDSMVRYVVSRTRAGAIVDLHDAEGLPGAPQRLLRALPEMIEQLTNEGYRLVSLSELLSLP
jgi:peptidoglycan/xylan/chitin deacetylase (PgdA/CDA1 family)